MGRAVRRSLQKSRCETMVRIRWWPNQDERSKYMLWSECGLKKNFQTQSRVKKKKSLLSAG